MAEFQQREHFWLFNYTELGKQSDVRSQLGKPHSLGRSAPIVTHFFWPQRTHTDFVHATRFLSSSGSTPRLTSAAGTPSGGRQCRTIIPSIGTSFPWGSCSKFFRKSAEFNAIIHYTSKNLPPTRSHAGCRTEQ